MNENLIRREELINRLLVEGSDDVHVCYHLFKYYHLDTKIDIIDKKGVDNILKTISAEISGSGDKRIGIVIDADDSLDDRWKTQRDILQASGYTNLPIDPIPEGTVIKEIEKPVIGVWIMPDNQLLGMLEHFVSFLVPENDTLWVTAENVVNEVIKQNCRFPAQHKIKAHVHTWLSWQEEPGKPLGQAITKRYLNPSAPHAQQFINWIRNVFDL